MERYLSNYADYPDKDQLLQSIEEGADAKHEVVPVSLCLRESVRKL